MTLKIEQGKRYFTESGGRQIIWLAAGLEMREIETDWCDSSLRDEVLVWCMFSVPEDGGTSMQDYVRKGGEYLAQLHGLIDGTIVDAGSMTPAARVKKARAK